MRDPAEDRPDVLISALEHYSYCARQFALIHIEQVFDENAYTIRGQQVHERVESGEASLEDGLRVLRDVPLWSERLGVHGKADVLELHEQGVIPVEYKLGPPRGQHAAIQLCAQALCLEEMLGAPVPYGDIFHVATRHRVRVDFTQVLRASTTHVIDAVRDLLSRRYVPAAANDRRCRHCSLIDSCLPVATCVDAPLAKWDTDLLE